METITKEKAALDFFREKCAMAKEVAEKLISDYRIDYDGETKRLHIYGLGTFMGLPGSVNVVERDCVVDIEAENFCLSLWKEVKSAHLTLI